MIGMPVPVTPYWTAPPPVVQVEKRPLKHEQCGVTFTAREHGLAGQCTRKEDHGGSHRVELPFGHEGTTEYPPTDRAVYVVDQNTTTHQIEG